MVRIDGKGVNCVDKGGQRDAYWLKNFAEHLRRVGNNEVRRVVTEVIYIGF
jgi:hypothetical protein